MKPFHSISKTCLNQTAVLMVLALSTIIFSVDSKAHGSYTPSGVPAITSPDAAAASKTVELSKVQPTELGLPVPTTPTSYNSHPKLQALSNQIATQYALDEQWVAAMLSQAKYNASVAKLIMPAANTGAKNWTLYRSRFVEPIRIRKGVSFWQRHKSTLEKASQKYGVPEKIIVAVIGVETIYGEQTGNFKVLDALSTLTFDFPIGRKDRSAFFQSELAQFLRLCADQKWNPQDVLGSYAGAIGWPQFMPSSIRAYAIDFDGDGHINLHQSVPDVIGSVANYLKLHGWKKDLPTHFGVQVPQSADALAYLLAPDIVPTFTVKEMIDRGARLDTYGQNHPNLLALVKLENANAAPTYIAGTSNFYVITRYNNSSYYALSVIDLAEAIAKKVM